jgi:hypothetical protein
MYSVYIKILLNHMQIMVLIAGFNFKWPEKVKSFLNSPGPIAISTDSIVSFDCIAERRNASTIDRY